MALRALVRNFKSNVYSNLVLRSRFFSALDTVSFTDRTHTCGALREDDIGKQVKLCGWVQHVRMNQFIVLRDWQGITQLLVPQDKSDLLEKTKSLSYETVIEINGTVKPRAPGQENLRLETGVIEVEVEDLKVLNPAIPTLPFNVGEYQKRLETGVIEVEVEDLKVLNPAIPTLPFNVGEYQKANESLRMQYRYLDIRTKQMQRNLRLRSKFIMKMREFLINKHGFVDVETPTLFRKTPGGAKEFVVPCQHKGKFFSLPQSPQQFKQLLMVGGIDRYFQIARCYRDEGAKPDRQPEFTQLDLEMSFVKREGVMSLIEDLLVHSWPDDDENVSRISSPFPHMTYEQVMRLYGIDKPDTRFDMKLNDLTDIQTSLGVQMEEQSDAVVAMLIPKGQNYFSNKEINNICKGVSQQISDFEPPDVFSVKVRDQLFWRHESHKEGNKFERFELDDNSKQKILSRLQAGPGDLVLVCFKNIANPNKYSAHEYLGRLRLKCADHIENEKGVKLRDKKQFNFLWVEDFPLFLPKEDGSEGLESAHHPFTDVHPEDRHMFYTEPSKVRGQHYDLVVNGNEVGGGSIRIHNTKDQDYVIKHVLKEDSNQLKHLLEAFTMGCPPHGGIALGKELELHTQNRKEPQQKHRLGMGVYLEGRSRPQFTNLDEVDHAVYIVAWCLSWQGLDRLLSVICGSPSIRDVIAFPKGSEGKDPMSGAPTEVSQSDLDLYHIQVKQTD